MNLIGINGFKTSGKDTAYKLLKINTTAAVGRAAFADKLKIMAAKALGFDRSNEELIALMDSFKEGAAISVLYEEPDAPKDPLVDSATLHSLTGREYLQWFGGHARDVFGDTFWIDQVLPHPAWSTDMILREVCADPIENSRQLEARYPGVEILCITDARYPNEAERIRDLGGVVWEVIRPGLESDGHSSETPLPRELIDWQIINDSDIETLRQRTVEAARETL